MDSFSGILPGNTPDATQCRGDSKFSPEELHKFFRCPCPQNYYDVITSSKHGDFTIRGSPPPTIGDLSTILNSPKGIPITRPTKLLQHIHMDIGYGDCVALGRHRYILALVNRATCYVWTYGIRALSGTDIIYFLQVFRLSAGRLPSKFYTDFEKQMVWGAVHKWLITNGSKTVAPPVVCQSQNGLVEHTCISLL